MDVLVADMAFAVFMDECSARYARSVEYRRVLERERRFSVGKRRYA